MTHGLGGVSRSFFAVHHGVPESRTLRRAAPVPVRIIPDLCYTPAGWPQALAADIYQPADTAGPVPAVMMVHGGGWTGGKRQDMHRTARAVARRGYVVMNVSYRLAPRWRYPAQLQDMQQALAWLHRHAGEYGAHTDRIATWGYSAGAHLALLPALIPAGHPHCVSDVRPRAVVAGGAPVDLTYYPAGPLTNALMGVGCHSNLQAWCDASPLRHVAPHSPPIFLYHGNFDLIVGANNSRAMYTALQDQRIPSELYLIRGLGHIPTFFLAAPVRRGCDFLDHHLRV
jgi:acetyl esterase/lipase